MRVGWRGGVGRGGRCRGVGRGGVGRGGRGGRVRGVGRGDDELLEQVEQWAAPGSRHAERLAGHDHGGDGGKQGGGQRRTGERGSHDQQHGRSLVGRGLVTRSLVGRGLVTRRLVGRGLVTRCRRPLHDGLEAGGPAARRRQDGAAPPSAARRAFKSSMAVTGAGSTP